MGSFFHTLISFLRLLFGFGPDIKIPLLTSSATPGAVANLKPADPSRAWNPCAWCDGLMSPDDYCELSSGEAVHISCRTKPMDKNDWLGMREKMIMELQHAYLALGETKEIENLIFRLHPGKDATLEDAFSVLRDLELKVRGLKTPDFRTASAAMAAIGQTRIKLRALLARA